MSGELNETHDKHNLRRELESESTTEFFTTARAIPGNNVRSNTTHFQVFVSRQTGLLNGQVCDTL